MRFYIVLLLVSSFSFAQDFVHVGTTSKNEDVSLRLEKEYSSVKYAWVKIVPPTDDFGIPIKTEYGNCLAYVALNCKEKTISYHEMIVYDSEGEVIDRQTSDISKAERIIPDSLGELILKFLCK